MKIRCNELATDGRKNLGERQLVKTVSAMVLDLNYIDDS